MICRNNKLIKWFVVYIFAPLCYQIREMKVNFTGYNLYKSKSLKKGLEFVADNGALFASATSLTLATVARPIAIYSTPKTDKENKKLACAKSISSSAVGFLLMLGASLPVSKSIKKINNSPDKYLKKETISNLKECAKPLTSSKPYQFATQMFKLGLSTAMAIPKSVITCALIPPVMALMFHSKQKKNISQEQGGIVKAESLKSLNFTGKVSKEPLTKGISKIIDNSGFQNFANKYKDTNYPMHITALADTLATATFAVQTKQNKNIKEERKKPLINNAFISTGLSILSTYVLDKVLDKPTEKFINSFKEVNKSSPKLDKYVEGIRIAKPTLLMGGIYYCVIPLVSTFFAERIGKRN